MVVLPSQSDHGAICLNDLPFVLLSPLGERLGEGVMQEIVFG
jgi:hypothetical protein